MTESPPPPQRPKRRHPPKSLWSLLSLRRVVVVSSAIVFVGLLVAHCLSAIDYRDSLSVTPYDSPLASVCFASDFPCGYSNPAIGSCSADGCSSCGKGWTHEAWVSALSNCAEPLFVRYFFSCLSLVLSLIRLCLFLFADAATKKDVPLHFAVLATHVFVSGSFLCLSMNLVVPYWCLLSIGLFLSTAIHHYTLPPPFSSSSSSHQHQSAAADRRYAFEVNSWRRLFLLIFPAASVAQVYSAIFIADFNDGIVVAVCCTSLRVFALATERPLVALVDVVVLSLVGIFYATLTPLTWVIWPAYVIYSCALVPSSLAEESDEKLKVIAERGDREQLRREKAVNWNPCFDDKRSS